MSSISKYHIPLIGVESEHCAMIVTKGLKDIIPSGGYKVEVNNRRLVVNDADSKLIPLIVNKITDLGYQVQTAKKRFPITGMSCASCANSVESAATYIPGIISSAVNFADASLLVEYIPELVDDKAIQKAVQNVGYDIITETESQDEPIEENLQHKAFQSLKIRTLLAAFFSVPLVIIGMGFNDIPYANYYMWGLSSPVLFIFGRQFFINAWKQLKHFSANMDTLVALSTGVAYFFSVLNTLYPDLLEEKGLVAHVYFEAAGVIVAFILLGKMLEEKAKSNTSTAIKKLMGLQPKTVIKISKDGIEEEIKIAEVIKGDILLVKPGQKIAVDGVVNFGESYVDESMISGEPVPVLKKNGEKVFAGTINQKGSFRFVAEKVGSETILAQIIEMVRNAQGSKAPVQKLVDKISGVFVPVVIIIAVLSLVVWLFFAEHNALIHGMLALVTVLVIACPCALGLATPTAIMVGVGKGAENGILIKDAESLELAHKIDAIILDKTGTITEGKPMVTDLHWVNQQSSELISVLHAMESQSEHPLAEAVKEHLGAQNPNTIELKSYTSITARGVQAAYKKSSYYIGNKKLMEEQSIAISEGILNLFQEWSEQAKTVVFFSDEKNVLALIAIADKIKENSKTAVQALHQLGIKVYMLTGDNSYTAEAVSKQVGIDYFKAEVMPADKAEFVEKLQKEGKTVAMVGDGINDSHALAQADVSIAMGKGSDIAMDVAKMTIISSDLIKIPQAIKLSGKTVRVIRQNLFWAFIYNIIGIPIAAGVLYPFFGFLLNPMIAGAAMALSSVSVVTNSLRLKWQKL